MRSVQFREFRSYRGRVKVGKIARAINSCHRSIFYAKESLSALMTFHSRVERNVEKNSQQTKKVKVKNSSGNSASKVKPRAYSKWRSTFSHSVRTMLSGLHRALSSPSTDDD